MAFSLDFPFSPKIYLLLSAVLLFVLSFHYTPKEGNAAKCKKKIRRTTHPKKTPNRPKMGRGQWAVYRHSG